MSYVLRSIFGIPLLCVAAFAMASPAAAQGDTQSPATTAPKPPKTPKPPKPAKPKPPAAPPAAAAAPAPARPADAMVGGVQPTLLGMFGDWGAYTAAPGGKKICFALAKPANSQSAPANRPRDPAFLFVSSRPAEKVRDEISIIIGYGFKPNTDASLELGGAAYAMYTQNDGAWIKNAAEEARLVDAMRKGSDVTVKGVSARGTATTDTFSLKGLAQALDKVGQDCQ
jgi:type IV secretory pathway VirB10-like protein